MKLNIRSRPGNIPTCYELLELSLKKQPPSRWNPSLLYILFTFKNILFVAFPFLKLFKNLNCASKSVKIFNILTIDRQFPAIYTVNRVKVRFGKLKFPYTKSFIITSNQVFHIFFLIKCWLGVSQIVSLIGSAVVFNSLVNRCLVFKVTISSPITVQELNKNSPILINSKHLPEITFRIY